jgi:predicted ATPase
MVFNADSMTQTRGCLMKIQSFHIENFRNLRVAECNVVSDFMVICGANGCGKSAILEALMTAKEHAGAYGNFNFDPRAVSADAEKATIKVELTFSEKERSFVKDKFGTECPEVDEVEFEIQKGGIARTIKRSPPVKKLLSFYSRSIGSPGFFDYINAHRQMKKNQLSTWDAGFLSDARAKETLAQNQNKFQYTKQYLAGLKMGDLQDLQSSLQLGKTNTKDSLADIRTFFNKFFHPMKFMDVHINTSPFQFVISTRLGNIDIDDLSSGEKEIINIFIRFHQLKPEGAIILFDEADAHLHPDLCRRYLTELKKLGAGNQILLTTHSPEMMMAAGTDALYTILKEPLPDGGNQLVRVTEEESLHSALLELMGSRGIISINQRIIFIEGEDASADREIYESLYPSNEYNISFVPVGNSLTVRSISEKVNHLLTTATGFQHYFSIIDGDVERLTDDPTEGKRLFRLPVYHVENFMIDEAIILQVSQSLMRSKCPYTCPEEITVELKRLLLSDSHVKPYAKALLDSRVANAAKCAYDSVYSKAQDPEAISEIPSFAKIEEIARENIQEYIDSDKWRYRCKGRELLKAYCGRHNIKYEHFRNLLISNMSSIPDGLSSIMKKILEQ